MRSRIDVGDVNDRHNQATWDRIDVSDFPATVLPSLRLPAVLISIKKQDGSFAKHYKHSLEQV